MELTAQTGAVNHSGLGTRTIQFRLAAEGRRGARAKLGRSESSKLASVGGLSGYHRGGGYSALQRRCIHRRGDKAKSRMIYFRKHLELHPYDPAFALDWGPGYDRSTFHATCL
jgi:hypothetical protein